MIEVLVLVCLLQTPSVTPSPASTEEEARVLLDKLEEKYAAQPVVRGTCGIKSKAKPSDEGFGGEGHFFYEIKFSPERVNFDIEGTLNKTKYHHGFEDTPGTLGEQMQAPSLFSVTSRSSFVDSDKESTEKHSRAIKVAFVRMGFTPAFIPFPARAMKPVKEAPDVADLAIAPPEKGAKANVKVLTWAVADSGEGEDKRPGAKHKVWVTADTLIIQKREITFEGGLTVSESWDPPKAAKPAKK